MKKKTKAKKKPIGAPLEGPQSSQYMHTDWGPVHTPTYTIRFSGVEPKTQEERIADLEKKVEKLEDSKADKPVYRKGEFRIKQARWYDEFSYAVQQFDGAGWNHEHFTDFQWTARRWIRKHYGTTAVILDGVHHA